MPLTLTAPVETSAIALMLPLTMRSPVAPLPLMLTPLISRLVAEMVPETSSWALGVQVVALE